MRVDVVFEGDGNAVERAAIAIAFATASGEKFAFGLLGLLEGEFVSDGEEGVQFGIELIDAGEKEFGEFDGREFAFAKQRGDLRDGSEGEVGVGGGRHGVMELGI